MIGFQSTSRIEMAMSTMASSLLPSSCTNYNQRGFPLRVAAVASLPFPQQQPINVDYLQQEFSGHGVLFKGIGDDCVAKMSLDNGSKAIMMLQSGIIASYKASMWHGGNVELLQSSVSQEEKEEEANIIQGGVSVALQCNLREEQVSWSPSTWALHDIRGNPQDSIQVELISTDSHDSVQVKYIVTLQDDVLSSQLMVSNNSDSSSLQLTGCILSHLTVSSPDATFAVGLERSDFFGRSPILTSSAIIPPDYGQKTKTQFSQFWKNMASNGWGPKNGQKTETEREEEEMEQGEEDDNYKNLREKICRIYTSAPRDFTIIDRGKRNSVVVGRDGFEELYMFSPGSSHEYYSKYAYICIGQSAVLNPIILGPKRSWTGGQRLHNPNL